ncbi:MAG TPA: MBL fold metallo-hydrolase [Burkholderiales bacterium]|nr:MBL fold metallo-hydrolase [Burkholderiales bacterium]
MRLAAACLLVVLWLPVPVVAGDAFEIAEVADGVYIAMRRPTAPMAIGSNAAIIINESGVLVVDTHYTPSAARALLAEIRKLTDKPVRYVVNTHWHNDHVQGNQAYFNVFPGALEFISSHATREDIEGKAVPSAKQELESLPAQITRGEEQLARGLGPEGQPLTDEQKQQRRSQLNRQKAYLEELRGLQITLPTLTFDHSLILHRHERPIHVLFFGRGHTRGDVVVYLPNEKIVITGDLVTGAASWPFPRDSYPAAWARTLRAIAALDFTRLIPGHGAVHPDKAHVERLSALFASIAEQVRAALGQGLTLEQAQQKVNVDALRDAITRDPREVRAFQHDLKVLVARAYLEAKAEPDK